MRRERRLSVSAAADLAGVSRQTLSCQENGQYLPSLLTLFKLLAALGYSWGEFGEMDAHAGREAAPMSAEERVAHQVGNALRRVREARGVRQYEVAELTGISKPVLSRYERGRAYAPLSDLVRVLQALDCSADEFGQHVGPWGRP
jgi:transcriptional regulator with XRE-family HTH domain